MKQIYGTRLGKFTQEHICQKVISIKLHTSEWIFSCKFTSYFQNIFVRAPLGTASETRDCTKNPLSFLITATFKPEIFSKMNFLGYDINFEWVWNLYHFKNPGFDFPFFKSFEKCVTIHPLRWISVQPRIIMVIMSMIWFSHYLNKFTCEHYHR